EREQVVEAQPGAGLAHVVDMAAGPAGQGGRLYRPAHCRDEHADALMQRHLEAGRAQSYGHNFALMLTMPTNVGNMPKVICVFVPTILCIRGSGGPLRDQG